MNQLTELSNRVLFFITKPENENTGYSELELSEKLNIDVNTVKAIHSKLSRNGLIDSSMTGNGYHRFHITDRTKEFALDGGFKDESYAHTTIHDNSVKVGGDFTGNLSAHSTLDKSDLAFKPITNPPITPIVTETKQAIKTSVGMFIINNIWKIIIAVVATVIGGAILWYLKMV